MAASAAAAVGAAVAAFAAGVGFGVARDDGVGVGFGVGVGCGVAVAGPAVAVAGAAVGNAVGELAAAALPTVADGAGCGGGELSAEAPWARPAATMPVTAATATALVMIRS
jgi:hypothetical protein